MTLPCHAEERGICAIAYKRPLWGRETLRKCVHTVASGGEQVFKHNNLNDLGVGLPYRKDAGDPSPAKTNPCFSNNAVMLHLFPSAGGYEGS
jgi:hypothetical protein